MAASYHVAMIECTLYFMYYREVLLDPTRNAVESLVSSGSIDKLPNQELITRDSIEQWRCLFRKLQHSHWSLPPELDLEANSPCTTPKGILTCDDFLHIATSLFGSDFVQENTGCHACTELSLRDYYGDWSADITSQWRTPLYRPVVHNASRDNLLQVTTPKTTPLARVVPWNTHWISLWWLFSLCFSRVHRRRKHLGISHSALIHGQCCPSCALFSCSTQQPLLQTALFNYHRRVGGMWPVQ